MIEFVVREGPMFEAMIMNREINNPMYRSVQLHISNGTTFLILLVVGIFCIYVAYAHVYYFFLPGFYLRTRAQHMYTTGGSSTPYYRFDFYVQHKITVVFSPHNVLGSQSSTFGFEINCK